MLKKLYNLYLLIKTNLQKSYKQKYILNIKKNKIKFFLIKININIMFK